MSAAVENPDRLIEKFLEAGFPIEQASVLRSGILNEKAELYFRLINEIEKNRALASENDKKIIEEIKATRIEQEDIRKETAAIRLEIEKVRAENKETENRLIKEIEKVRGENKETEIRLIKEIDTVRLEIEKVRGENKESEKNLIKEIEKLRGETLAIELRLTERMDKNKYLLLYIMAAGFIGMGTLMARGFGWW